jgi:hypothetical protein
MASDGAAGSIFLLFVRSPPHRLLGRDPPLETLTKENLHWAELHVERDGQTDGVNLLVWWAACRASVSPQSKYIKKMTTVEIDWNKRLINKISYYIGTKD